MLNIECPRPHCAIRSHRHELLKTPPTFAEKLGYLPQFCDVAKKYSLNNEQLFEDYNFLIHKSCLLKGNRCVSIILKMLRLIHDEENVELRKLRIMYLFTMVATPFWIHAANGNRHQRLLDAIQGAYNRVLECDDVDFVGQIVIIFGKTQFV